MPSVKVFKCLATNYLDVTIAVLGISLELETKFKGNLLKLIAMFTVEPEMKEAQEELFNKLQELIKVLKHSHDHPGMRAR